MSISLLMSGILGSGGVADVAAGTLMSSNTDSSDAASHTYSPGEFPAHKLLVGVFTQTGVSNEGDITSVTIGGASATAVTSAIVDLAFAYLRMYEATPTAGNNGQIVINTTSMLRSGYALWSVNGLTSANGNGDFTNGGTVVTLDLNTTASDYAFGLGMVEGTQTATWTNLTEEFETTVESNTMTAATNTSVTGGTPEAFDVTYSSSGNIRGVISVYN